MTRTAAVLPSAVVAIMLLVGLCVAHAPLLALGLTLVTLIIWSCHRWPGHVVVALLFWVTLDGWALKYVRGGSSLLVLPDVVSGMLAVVVGGRVMLHRIEEEEMTTLKQLLGPVTLLLVAATVSWLVNQSSILDALYWVRVHFRFVPLGLAMAISDIRVVVVKRLPSLAVLIVLTQSVIAFAEYLGGRAVAEFFWPGQFSLGPIATQADTLKTVGSRVVAGTLGHYNILGMTIVLWLAVLLGAMSIARTDSHRVPLKWSFVFATSLGAVVVLLSQSRQSFAMLLLLVLAWLLQANRFSERARTVSAVAVMMMVVSLSHTVSEAVKAFMLRIAQLGDRWFWAAEASKNRGYVLFEVTTAVFRRAPLLGLGPGSLGTSYASAAGPTGVAVLGLDPMSSRFVGDVGWVSVASQVGLFGVAALVRLAAIMTKSVLGEKSYGLRRFAAVGCLLILGIGMFASTPLTYKAPSSLFWVLAGVGLAQQHGQRGIEAVTG